MLKNFGKSPSDEMSQDPAPQTTHTAPFTFIDLFAGCGGLSLGLEAAGFRPLLFSEISPHAAETYIANRTDMDVVPVGDIHNLTDLDLNLLKTYWNYKGIRDVDLVCGGPPCQGFSGIGHRRTFNLDKKDILSNHLFKEMVRVIRVVRPKLFLFENVRGLLNARWQPNGRKGEIFQTVLAEFKSLDQYQIRWDLLHAKDYGVPQNRPRVIMVGIRDDVLRMVPWLKLNMSIGDAPGVESGFIPRPAGEPPSIPELLSDLEDPSYPTGSFSPVYLCNPRSSIQARLRTKRDGRLLATGDPVTEQDYSHHSNEIRTKFSHMISCNGNIPAEFKTKKFAQRVLPRVWGPEGPNITATSLPDDYVHYLQPRSLTVREWARLQTFPDWYVFKGPRTTGGRRRAGDPSLGVWQRDVPKYTQIGNAVPVLMAEAIGRHLAGLLGVWMNAQLGFQSKPEPH